MFVAFALRVLVLVCFPIRFLAPPFQQPQNIQTNSLPTRHFLLFPIFFGLGENKEGDYISPESGRRILVLLLEDRLKKKEGKKIQERNLIC